MKDLNDLRFDLSNANEALNYLHMEMWNEGTKSNPPEWLCISFYLSMEKRLGVLELVSNQISHALHDLDCMIDNKLVRDKEVSA